MLQIQKQEYSGELDFIIAYYLYAFCRCMLFINLGVVMYFVVVCY